jgi:DNA-binding LacI/PurR family transcriptional regulator
MVDVARLAEVSQQTVSRVVNAHPNVRPEVRERVLEAIERLNYRPNSAARALATSRSMNLGVVSFGLAQHGPSVALFGIAEEARRHGYATSLVPLGDLSTESFQAAMDHLADTNVDGVIALAPVHAAYAALDGLQAQFPMAIFDPAAEEGSERIGIDETRGARLATRHLLELGHETVWHVRGPRGWKGTDARVRGWTEELSSRGLFSPPPFAGDWSTGSGYRAGAEIAHRPEITAVFVANDQMAIGVVKALTDLGLRVPEDVSVVGFDDIPEAAYVHPSLTTVRLDFDEVGRRCVERILAIIQNGETTAPNHLIQPELLVRSSTASPRAST